MRYLLLILAALAAAAPALAEDRALMRPTRDVEVEYRSSGMAQGPMAGAPGQVVTIHFASKGNRIRIDAPNGRGAAIFDAAAHRMIVIMQERHMYLERPADPNMMPMFSGTIAHLVKTGTDTVAGLSCTVYQANTAQRKGEVCLTDDGVLLRAHDMAGDHEFKAVKVTYVDQPDSLFVPPPGFQKLEIPNMPNGVPGGMPPMGPGGMPPGAMGPGGPGRP